MNLLTTEAQRRKIKMNESPGSQDVAVNQSPPHSTPPKKKKTTLWKRLKSLFRRKNNGKCCDDVSHPMKAKMTESPGSQDVALNQSPPHSTPPKKKKTTLWERLKSLFRRKKKEKCCDDVSHPMSAEPPMTKQSLEEELQAGLLHSKRKDDESDSSVDVDSYYIERKNDEKLEEHEVIGNWVVIDQIGEGGLGLVYKAKNIKSAVKGALKKAKCLDDSTKLWHEAVKIVALNNPNIVKLFEVIENPISKQVVIVMEYVAGGSLHHQLSCRKTFSLVDGWHVIKQMVSAFAYLHSEKMVHRDIKLDNVLCNNQLAVKIIDFGFARFFRPGEILYDGCGTPDYMAPEISEDGYEGPPADVWSLGILSIKLFLGLAFDISKDISGVSSFVKVHSKLSQLKNEGLNGLLLGMICHNPRLRFTMENISEHTWLRKRPSL